MDCVLSHTTPMRYMPRHAFLPMAVGSSGRRVRKGRHLVMIIAAYAGAGKSTFAKRAEGAVDLATMPRRWFLSPSDGKDGAYEGEKSAVSPSGPALSEQLHFGRFEGGTGVSLCADSHQRQDHRLPVGGVRQAGGPLLSHGRPERDLPHSIPGQGNSEDFESIFIGNWEYFPGPF